jgi:tetratricopeptide (TPR) repeat protein
MEEARKEYEEALKIFRELAQKNPETYRPDMATAFVNLGIVYWFQHRMEEARKELDEALKIRRELADKNPEAYL